jgi:hypothetical protein
MAEYLFGASKSIINKPDYQGAQITMDGNTINVTDKPNTAVKQIAFNGLIGQPTWIEPLTIAFKCAMRADITIGDRVMMPKTLTNNTQQAQSSLINQKAAQQGAFIVTSVHHIGSFRQLDAYSWVTEFSAVATNVQPAS